MVDPVFRDKTQRTAHKITSWLDCLVLGRRRRQNRRVAPGRSTAAHVEQLEDRTLLTASPFAPEFEVTIAADMVRSLVAADIDGDGDMDLVSAEQNADEVTWWENSNGDGTVYIPHMVTSFASGAISVAVADMDGDGDLDILSASRYDNTIAWYENENGDGSSFRTVIISANVIDVRSIVAADIDGDGDIDVVSASYGDDKISWHSNTAGDGTTWTENVITTTADGANSVFVADIDGDTDLDIVSASLLDDSIVWYDNVAGDGAFFNANVVSSTVTGAAAVVAADIDGDSDIDFLVAASADDEVQWYENNGQQFSPSFAKRVVATTADGVNGLFVADVDNDGDADLLSASPLDDQIILYENNGDVFDPLFTSRTLSDTADGAYAVIAVDVDGDGDIDVVSASGLDDKIAIYRNESIHRNAAFPTMEAITDDADGAYAVAIGDLDGDGDNDIVSASLYDSTIQWFRNDSTDPLNPIFTQFDITPFEGVRDIELFDIDRDGNLDIIFASASTNTVNYLSNIDGDGLNFPEFQLLVFLDAARSVDVADINGNGIPDIIAAASGEDTILWMEIDYTTLQIDVNTITTTADGARDAIAADIDGDGDMDVVTASYYDDKIVWYENTDGDGLSWAPRVLDTNADGARSVQAADMDGDGDMDVIAASTYDNSIRWYENDGNANPTFTKHLISSEEKGAQAVSIADLDNDGDMDIVSVAEFPTAEIQSRVAYFVNDGADDPTFAKVDIDTTNDRPNAVAIGDIDGDGDADVVSTSMFDDSILFYKNSGGQLGLATEDTSPAEFVAGAVEEMLKITATHNGRAGDSDLEIDTMQLRLESAPGVPLTQTEANALLFDLEIWLDDGDGVYDADNDTQVIVANPLVVDIDGLLTIEFADGDPNIQIAHGTPRTYFLVAETTANSFLLDPRSFVITHNTELGSTAEDAVYDIAASVEFSLNVATSLTEVSAPNVPLPGVPSIIGPAGLTDDSTPTFSWTAPVGAQEYDLMVYQVESGDLVLEVDGILATSYTPTTPLEANKTYRVVVRAINVADETGGFSTPEYFALDPMTPIPAVPSLTGPAATVLDTTPIITWTSVADADDYDLLIYDIRSGQELNLGSVAITGTSYTTIVPLTPDSHFQIFVRANNAGGSSGWSAPLQFNLPIVGEVPAGPILTGPASQIPDNTPTITWAEFPNAVSYDLLMYSITKGQEVLSVTGIAAAQYTTPSLVVPDTYQVFVRANMVSGQKSVYGTPLVFGAKSAAPIPGVTTVVTPDVISEDGTPTIIWSRVAAATTYEIVAYNVTPGSVSEGRQVFFATGGTERFFSPGALASGVYQVHVRALNAEAEPGAWSSAFQFQIAENDEQISEPLAPTDELPEATPLVPDADAVFVSLESDSIDSFTVEPVAEQSPLDTISAAATDTPTDTQSVAAVMAEWPETEWWADDMATLETAEETPVVSDTQAAALGIALGLALPAADYVNGKRTRKRQKANDRRSER